MRPRLFGLLAAVIWLLAEVQLPAAAQQTLRFTGRPGQFALFELTATTTLGNGGADSEVRATSGRWEGLLIRRVTEGYRAVDFYLHLRPRASWVCGSRPCNENPGLDFLAGSRHELPDGNYVYRLRPGKYLIALVGDPGARVTASLHLRGLRAGTARELQPIGTVPLQTHEFESIVEDSEKELVSRGFKGRDTDSPHETGLIIAYDFAVPGAVMTSTCFFATDQGNGEIARTACADGGGAPAPPSPVLLGNRMWGRRYTNAQSPPDAFVGYGYDLELQTTGDAHISALWWSMDLPAPSSLRQSAPGDRKTSERTSGTLPDTGTSDRSGKGLAVVLTAVALGWILRPGRRAMAHHMWPKREQDRC